MVGRDYPASLVGPLVLEDIVPVEICLGSDEAFDVACDIWLSNFIENVHYSNKHEIHVHYLKIAVMNSLLDVQMRARTSFFGPVDMGIFQSASN